MQSALSPRTIAFAVDANSVLGMVTNQSGRELIANPVLRLIMAEYAFGEFVEHLPEPLQRKVNRGIVTQAQADAEIAAFTLFVRTHIRIVPQSSYDTFETEARDRIPGDPDDWHTVALALTFGSDIWTNDNHFLGCGVSVWTNETLKRRLAAGRL